MGRLRTETGPFGTVVSNSYDEAGRLTEVAFGSLNWTYQYDALDRITNVVAPEGDYGIAYLQQGARKVSVRYPNGVVESNGYDDWTRTTNRVWLSGTNSLLSIGYSYDAGDRRTNEVWGGGRRIAYAYDRTYQLTNSASTAWLPTMPATATTRQAIRFTGWNPGWPSPTPSTASIKSSTAPGPAALSR